MILVFKKTYDYLPILYLFELIFTFTCKYSLKRCFTKIKRVNYYQWKQNLYESHSIFILKLKLIFLHGSSEY